MINYELDIDEGILLQSTELERIGKEELSLDEMVLTNKNIICVYEKSNGLFKQSDMIVEKLPLSTIKVVNGKVQASLYDDDEYGKGLRIWFKDGHREHILFSSSPKKEIPFWVDAISEAITGEPAVKEAPKKKASILGGLSAVLSGEMDMQAVAEKVSSKLNDISEKCYEVSDKLAGKSQSDCNGAETEIEPDKDYETIEIVSVAEADAVSQVEGKPNEKYIYCSNCGEKLIATAKFCQGCGVKVGTVIIEEDLIETLNESRPTQEDYTERKSLYDGKIHKCPNCGDIIDAYETVCEACGYEIRGRKTTSVVHELTLKLEKIDDIQKRKKMIRDFYIPNTREDIHEFFILATSNIKAGGADLDAWLVKLEQAYQKAELAFSNSSEFDAIKTMYDSATKNYKKNKSINSFLNIGNLVGKIIEILKGPNGIFVILVCAVAILFIGGFGSMERKHENHIEYLDELVVEVNEHIEAGEYDLARVKASQIDDDSGWSSESEEKWDNVRETLLETIEKKEKEAKKK